MDWLTLGFTGYHKMKGIDTGNVMVHAALMPYKVVPEAEKIYKYTLELQHTMDTVHITNKMRK